MLINHSLPGEMVSLEKDPAILLAVKKVCVKKDIWQLNIAPNLKKFMSCQILLKETKGLELYVKVLLTIGQGLE